MPELPEVETIKRDLAAVLPHQRIIQVRIFDSRVIRNISATQFKAILKGKSFGAIHRRGKAIILEIIPGKKLLVVQPMMTGQLVVSREPGQRNVEGGMSPQAPQDSLVTDKHTKVVFLLSNGRPLLYNDQRIFGRLQIVDDLSEIKYFRILGPEPLENNFSVGYLEGILRASSRPVKTLLMDHTRVAGIGNIYASEILFLAGIRPGRRADQVRKIEVPKLFQAIQKVLAQAIRQRGTSMRNYRDGQGERGKYMTQIKVYDRAGEKCPACTNLIQKTVMAGRSTFYCRGCQK